MTSARTPIVYLQLRSSDGRGADSSCILEPPPLERETESLKWFESQVVELLIGRSRYHGPVQSITLKYKLEHEGRVFEVMKPAEQWHAEFHKVWNGTPMKSVFPTATEWYVVVQR